MKRIAIFASGSGTNAERLALYFRTSAVARVVLILSNRPDAFVIQRAERLGIQSHVFTRQEFQREDGILQLLLEQKIDFVVLAGFLWLVPPPVISNFKGKIVNIHPALLPKYGGKNMYGQRVHEAVIAAGETESGITIHRVDEVYDNGAILFQARCAINPDDSPSTLAAKIHQLEYEHFPRVIENLL
jgi:phosphoribosylglycinamide formyltransferase-1